MLIKHLIEPLLLEQSQEPLTKLLLVEDNPGDVRAVEETLAAQNIGRFVIASAATLRSYVSVENASTPSCWICRSRTLGALTRLSAFGAARHPHRLLS